MDLYSIILRVFAFLVFLVAGIYLLVASAPNLNEAVGAALIGFSAWVLATLLVRSVRRVVTTG